MSALLLFLLALPLRAADLQEALQSLQEESRKSAEPQKTKKPSAYDTDYFTDADSLRTGPSVSGGPAAGIPKDKSAFCARSHQDIVSDLNSFLKGFSSTLAFDNPDGDFNTGLCWLHSRYQRSASYLLHLRPDLPNPGAKAVKKAVWDLAEADRVVTLGGYTSLDEFSRENEKEITKALNALANRCVLGGHCATRFGDTWQEEPGALRARVERLYQRMLKAPRILFLREEAKDHGPLTSHSLLLLSVKPLGSPAAPNNPLSALTPSGYSLLVIDPNHAKDPRTVLYRFGDRSLVIGKKGSPFLVYEDYDDELVDIEQALKRYCKP